MLTAPTETATPTDIRWMTPVSTKGTTGNTLRDDTAWNRLRARHSNGDRHTIITDILQSGGGLNSEAYSKTESIARDADTTEYSNLRLV